VNISYETFTTLCNEIHTKIGDRRYDGIICPLRGGFYLSDFLSRKMNLPVYYLEINSYNSYNSYNSTNKKREFNFTQLSNIPEKGNFLICDDIYDTGDTVEFIKKQYPFIYLDCAVVISKQYKEDIVYGYLDRSTDWVDFFYETK
jgi:hypoxanthine phosphoribosyltransferase